jgi:hypothetical protein
MRFLKIRSRDSLKESKIYFHVLINFTIVFEYVVVLFLNENISKEQLKIAMTEVNKYL